MSIVVLVHVTHADHDDCRGRWMKPEPEAVARCDAPVVVVQSWGKENNLSLLDKTRDR